MIYQVYDESTLAVKDNAELPHQCVDCGAINEHDLNKKIKKFSYVRPAVYLWILLSPVIFLIAYIICRKSFRLHIWRCKSCIAKQARALKIFFISCMILIAFMLLYHFESNVYTKSAFIISIGLLFISVFVIATHSSRLAAKGISDNFFLIKGLNKQFVMNIMKQ